MSYPKFLYHKDHGKKLLQNEAEEKALGAGWVDTPAKIKEEKTKVEKPKAEPAKAKTKAKAK